MGDLLPNLHLPGLQGENPSVGHGVPGVHRQVQKDLVELPRVHPNPPDPLLGTEVDLDVLPQKALEHLQGLPDPLVEIHHPRLQDLPPAEGQKLPGEIRRPLPQPLHLLQVLRRRRRPVQMRPPKQVQGFR